MRGAARLGILGRKNFMAMTDGLQKCFKSGCWLLVVGCWLLVVGWLVGWLDQPFYRICAPANQQSSLAGTGDAPMWDNWQLDLVPCAGIDAHFYREGLITNA